MEEEIIIGVDSRPAEAGGNRVIRTLREILAAARGAGAGIDSMADNTRRAGGAASGAEREIEELRREVDRLNRSQRDASNSAGMFGNAMSGLRNTFGDLRGAIALLGIGLLVREFLQATDTMKKLESQVRMTLDANTSFATAWGNVRQIARETRMDLEGTVDLYTKMARSQGALGISSQQVADVTRAYALTLRISGADAQTAAASIRQFAQAMGRGKLSGDEFITMQESNIRGMQVIADHMRVTTGELHKMAGEGKLTGVALARAFSNPEVIARLRQEFAMTAVSFAEASQAISDEAMVMAGAFDRGGGLSRALTDFMIGGATDLAELELKFEDAGANIGAAWTALRAMWDPMTEGGQSFFDFMAESIAKLREDIANMMVEIQNAWNFVMGLWDNSADWLHWGVMAPVTSVMDWVPFPGENLGTRLYNWTRPEQDAANNWGGATFGDRFKRDSESALESNRFHASEQRRWLALTPTEQAAELASRERTGAPIASYMRVVTPREERPRPAEEEETRRRRANPNPRRTPEQAMRAFLAELEKEGLRPNAGPNTLFRTRAQQADLHRRMPGVAAAPGTSDHEYWRGVDLPHNADEQAIRRAADRAGVDVRQVLRHGGRGNEHTHVGLGRNTGNVRPTNDGSNADALIQREERRIEATRQFMENSETEVATARMLTTEAAEYNDLLRVREIVLDGLNLSHEQQTEEQRAQLAAAEEYVRTKHASLRLAQLEGEVREQTQAAAVEEASLVRQLGIYRTVSVENLARELEIEQRMAPLRESALRKGLDITQGATKEWLDQVEAQERSNQALRERLALLQQGVEVLRTYGGRTGALLAGMREADEAELALNALYRDRGPGSALAPEDQIPQELFDTARRGIEQMVWELEHEFELSFGSAIVRLGDQLEVSLGRGIAGVVRSIGRIAEQLSAGARGDTQGAGIIGSVVELFGGADSAVGRSWQGRSRELGERMAAGEIRGLTSSFEGFKTDFKAMFSGEPGAFSQGMGKLLADAGMGAQIGELTHSLANLVGYRKFSRTGAQAGGAIGNTVAGPIGGAIGSVVGGVGGGLLKSTPRGVSTLSFDANGALVAGSGRGSSKALRESAEALGGSVGSGLQSIADAIGGTLGGSLSVSIGQRNDKFVVDPTGKGRTKGSGVLKFEDEAAAIAAAVKDAIKDGVLTGISPESQRVLKGAKDPATVLNAVAAYEKLGVEVLKMTDPAKAAIEEFMDEFAKLEGQMRRAGYSTAELGKLEELYVERRKALMKELTQPFRDIIDAVTMGPNSGKSVALQYADAATKFGAFERDLTAGKRVDSGEFTAAGQTLFDLARQMFGSTTEEFALVKQRLVDASNKAIGNIETETPADRLKAAVDKAGAETVSQLQTANGLLTRILEAVKGGGANDNASAGGRVGFEAAASVREAF